MPEQVFRITGDDQRRAWSERSTPPVEEVRPGVWSIPIDFGHAPIRYTFCYLLVAPSGEAVIVDPGGDSELGRAQLASALALAGVDASSVVGVVSTHVHLDHVGMIAHAASLGGGWIAYHERDHDIVRRYRRPDVADIDRAWLRDCGTPEDVIDDLAVDPADSARMTALPDPTLVVRDGDLLPVDGLRVRVVETPGHTPGHICLVDEERGLFFSGDHVLPRITSNIGMTSTGARRGALADYHRSLDRARAWDGAEVCPAHEYRFVGLAARASELATHQRERSDEIVGVVELAPQTVWDIAAAASWARPWESFDALNRRAALGETAAHVDDLLAGGRLELVSEAPLRVRRSRPSPVRS